MALYCANAREIAGQFLGPTLEAVEARGGLEAHVRDIKTSLWSEFAVGRLNGTESTESELFWEALCTHNPQLAVDAAETFAMTVEKDRAYESAKSAILRASRVFFSFEMESVLIRPLAVRFGYIPVEVDVC